MVYRIDRYADENHLGNFGVFSMSYRLAFSEAGRALEIDLQPPSRNITIRSLARISQPHSALYPASHERECSQGLPSRTEVVQYVDLSPEERVQYEAVRRSAIGEIQNLAVLPDIKDQRFKILALLTRLRQFACHPGIVNKNWDRSYG